MGKLVSRLVWHLVHNDGRLHSAHRGFWFGYYVVPYGSFFNGVRVAWCVGVLGMSQQNAAGP